MSSATRSLCRAPHLLLQGRVVAEEGTTYLRLCVGCHSAARAAGAPPGLLLPARQSLRADRRTRSFRSLPRRSSSPGLRLPSNCCCSSRRRVRSLSNAARTLVRAFRTSAGHSKLRNLAQPRKLPVASRRRRSHHPHLLCTKAVRAPQPLPSIWRALSGVTTMPLIPLFWLKAWRERSRRAVVFALSVTLPAFLQSAILLRAMSAAFARSAHISSGLSRSTPPRESSFCPSPPGAGRCTTTHSSSIIPESSG